MTLAASSTHDTKRSEDVRARLHVLSEVADEWIAAVERWRRMNARHRTDVSGEEAPDGVAELFLYQNILGAWPVEETGDSEFTERMVSYAIKASREAKKRTSWIEPNEEYENAVTGFVRGILGCDEWRAEAERLLAKVVFPGAINSLSALVFKLASPGVADFYQGMELWDFSLVDPDNRRPVDYERRRRVLGEIVAMAEKPGEGAIADLLRLWRDGRIKMFVTHRGLCLRRKMRDVFLRGGYVPRRASGLRADHVCAFARRHEGRWVVATAAVRVARMIAEDGKAPGAEDWGDTSIELPEDAPIRMRDALTGRDLVVEGGRLAVGDALRHLPIALLYA